MPRRPRQESSTGVYHWITRGINRRTLFHFKDDYLYFLDLVREHSKEQNLRVFHYCLMPNHIHMLIESSCIKAMSLFSHFVKRKYAYYHSKTSKNRGASFERMYKSLPINDDTHLLECARYIERNPLRAGLASDPANYSYSSYCYYVSGTKSDILTPSPSYIALASDGMNRQRMYAEYVKAHRPQEEYASPKPFEF